MEEKVTPHIHNDWKTGIPHCNGMTAKDLTDALLCS